MRIVPFGEAALLVELEQRIDLDVAAEAAAIADAWEASGAGPAVPAYASALLRYDPLALDAAEAESRARHAAERATRATMAAPREIEIPTVYDGPDLPDVAEASGLSVEDVVAIHSAASYRAYFVGFMPGFAYLGPLDPRIRAPRLAAPRARVPAGSVAVIDGQTAVYPLASPGGWRLIGRTAARVFDPERDPAPLIRAGDLVRFARSVPAR